MRAGTACSSHAASAELRPHGVGAAGQVPAGPARAALMLIVPYRSVLTERRRKISDRSSGTRDPACPTVRRPGAAVATDLEPVATYLEFLMAAITDPNQRAAHAPEPNCWVASAGLYRSRAAFPSC